MNFVFEWQEQYLTRERDTVHKLYFCQQWSEVLIQQTKNIWVKCFTGGSGVYGQQRWGGGTRNILGWGGVAWPLIS